MRPSANNIGKPTRDGILDLNGVEFCLEGVFHENHNTTRVGSLGSLRGGVSIIRIVVRGVKVLFS